MPQLIRTSARPHAALRLEDALCSPRRGDRFDALEAAAEDLEAHAQALATFAVECDDPEALARLKTIVREHRWPEHLDRWSQVLVGWAHDDLGLGTTHDERPPGVLARGTAPRPTPLRAARPWQWVAGLLAVAEVLLVLGHRVGALGGLPKGADASGHISKIAMLVRAFPHISWNPYWYAGVPHFESSYPPLLHLLGALLVGATGMRAADAVLLLGALSVFVSAACLYAIARIVSQRHLVGFAAATIFLASPDLWSQVAISGAYARVLALACASVAVLAAVLHASEPRRGRLVAAAVALAAAMAAHLLVAVVGCALVGMVLVLTPAPTWRLRLWRAAAVGLPAFGLAAFFYIPFALLPRPTTGAATGTQPSDWSTFFWPSDSLLLDALPATIIPLVAVSCAAVVVIAWRRRGGGTEGRLSLFPAGKDGWVWATGIGCGVVGLGCAGWAVAGHLGVHIALYGVNPFDFYIYASWALPVFAAAAVGYLARRSASAARVMTGLCVLAAAAALTLSVPLVSDKGRDIVGSEGRRETQAMFPAEAANQSQYRVGGATDEGQDWVGSLYDTPVVRGYQNQGTVNVDWQFWIERALWDRSLPAPNRRFALDWYAVRWLYTDLLTTRLDATLVDDPAYVRLAASRRAEGLDLFEAPATGPIAAASAAPTSLVIAKPHAYATLFRALGSSGAGPSQLVPVEGETFVDDYSAQELARYDSVVVYEASAHNWGRAAALLESYARRGGRVFIEAAGLPAAAARALAGISPAEEQAAATTSSWAFEATSDPLLDGLVPTAFSPPRYNFTSPWTVAVVSRLAPDAHAVLSGFRGILLAERPVGQGVVLWSGMNLPYHAASFDNDTEGTLLARLLGAAGGPTSPEGTARRVDAGHWVVDTPGDAPGVLVKETFSDAWRASVDGRLATIVRAGPSFMYVAVPPDGRGHHVELTYHLLPVDWIGWTVSIATVLGLGAFLLRRRPPAVVLRVRNAVLGPNHLVQLP